MEMTRAEVVQAMNSLEKHIESYIQLIMHTGLNVQKGQEVCILSNIEIYPFTRRLVAEAYRQGSGPVTVIYDDDIVRRENFRALDLEAIKNVPEWEIARLNELAERNAAFLFLDVENPDVFNDVDSVKIQARSSVLNDRAKVFRKGLDYGHNAWLLVAVPTQAWAAKVFPKLSDEEALYRLWYAVLSASRCLEDDPIAEWNTHNAAFKKNLRFLNEKKFKTLRYTSKNGTNLTVGLADKHIWDGGAAVTSHKQQFFPNIPTEEVYTVPDRNRVDGIVYSVLPLMHHGQLIDEFWLKFKDGKVIDFDAKVGRDVLAAILEVDEAAGRLGEVALVSKNTPIRQSNTLFYSTLFDENASCHFALGAGFPECYEGGLEMSLDELVAHGVNHSNVHVDFMVGSDDLCIMGIDEDGKETRVFVSGQWVWE